MRLSRIFANLVGFMLFVQVILGGASVLLNFPIGYHLVWGIAAFIVLLIATGFIVRDYGSRSTLFRVCVAAIVDFVVQGILGLFSFSSDTVVVIHLANAFILAIIVTYLISFAVSAQRKAVTPRVQVAGSPTA